MTVIAETKTIGTDNGIGDIFLADVQYNDGSVGRVVVYGGNLQGASRILNLYKNIYGFVVTNLS
jgi:hypothetical protein